MGAGQKKQLSTSGVTVVYKCVTQRLYTSHKVIFARNLQKNSFGISFVLKCDDRVL